MLKICGVGGTKLKAGALTVTQTHSKKKLPDGLSCKGGAVQCSSSTLGMLVAEEGAAFLLVQFLCSLFVPLDSATLPPCGSVAYFQELAASRQELREKVDGSFFFFSKMAGRWRLCFSIAIDC